MNGVNGFGFRATSIYDFAYDELDRVTEANFSEEYFWEEIINADSSNEYISRRLIRGPSEIYSAGYSYDGAGNIETIWRNGFGTACEGPSGRIDDMDLVYGGLGGQQLMTVTDAATPNLRPFGFKPHDSAGHGSLLYTYDNNGNMTYDPHKELGLIYNFLNFPEQANGPQNSFSTVYDATGRKWKKETTYVDTANNTISKTLLYVGAMEFEETPEYNLRLASINGHEDGRAVPLYSESLSGDVPQRIEYYHKDHLGNVRLTFSDLNEDGVIIVGSIYDPTNEIVLEKHYYPFGLEQTGAWFATVIPDNQYRYNGKELDEAKGLYDYGARYYDPAIARFPSIDRFADRFAYQSPYVYAGNNPILFVDVNGDSLNIYDYQDKNSNGAEALISGLENVSGLDLHVNAETGNVSILGRLRNENGKKVKGSKTARKILKSLIGDKNTTVSVVDNTGHGTKVVNHENIIRFDSKQNPFLQNYLSKDLNPETWGPGLTFFHELGHTTYGGRMSDPGGDEAYITSGDIEVIPNQIRRELGPRYGQRMAYKHTEITTMYEGIELKGRYLPFSQSALDAIKTGRAPSGQYHGPI